MSGLKAVAAVLAFALEIAMLAAFAIFGYSVATPALLGAAVAIVIDGAVILAWGAFLAPKAAGRLPFGPRVAVEFALESASAVALFVVGEPQWAAILGVLIVLRFVLGLSTGADREGL